MTKYVSLFVVTVFLGSFSGRAMSAGPQNDGPQAAASGEQNPASPEWIISYYRNPQPDRFVAEVRKMSESGILSSPDAEPPTVAFLSRVLAKNPAKIAVWMAALANLPDSDKTVLHKAIWLSDTDAGRAYLKEHGADDLLKEPVSDTLKKEIDSPSVIDMLWGYFFATGDEAPIRRIVSAFNLSKYAGALDRYEKSEKTADDKEQAYYDAIFRAAVSSLSSNWQQHQRIKDICKELLNGKELNPTETECLKMMLANLNADKEGKNETSPGQASKDATESVEPEWAKGEQGFAAMLVFSNKPQQFLEDWSKPTAAAEVHMSESASRGKPCAAFIIFSGCGVDKQGLADVVADIRVLTPDGKVVGEQKAVDICQKHPAPPDKQQQLGVGNLGFVIEPNDPAGAYEVHAKVSDRLKGVVLDLKTKFSVDK